jgi:uncharacterized protein (DUF488 family)
MARHRRHGPARRCGGVRGHAACGHCLACSRVARVAAGREDHGALLTFGHGTATQAELVRLLSDAQVTRVVDVRRFPGSRRHPHVASAEMERWLPEAGIAYRWEPRLGGRRRLPVADDDVDTWWEVDAFRAYAAYTRTSEFRDALTDVLADVRAGATAVMCSESLWWRCHRRLIADVAVLLHAVPVLHLGHDGRLSDHRPAAGARLTQDGLVYDRAT